MSGASDPTGSPPAAAEGGNATSGAAWEEYLAAARALDAVRRNAATAASELVQAVEAAGAELTAVRARLAPQQSRLRDLGVPEWGLQPSATEVEAAAQGMLAGPAAVLASLRQARVTADAADAALMAGGAAGWRPAAGAGHRPWLRNLLVYGPYALVALVVQVVLYLVVDSVSFSAVMWGLLMPAAAFAVGWVTVGLAFPPGPGGRIDRTPLLGVVVCVVAPVVLSCVGAVVLRFT
ncbi:MAG TPA: hypothetical protein VFX60_11685 [Micromonospora sp.]|nr:hypothetical protein [Micromonospora sp.]